MIVVLGGGARKRPRRDIMTARDLRREYKSGVREQEAQVHVCDTTIQGDDSGTHRA